MRRTDWGIALGGAACWREDYDALLAMFDGRWPGLVIAANDIAVHFPDPIHHWVTLHPEKLAGWEREREAAGRPGIPVTWGRSYRYCARQIVEWDAVSSGGLAIQVAVERLGIARLALIGMPHTATPHFPESTADHLVDAEGNWKAKHADQHFEALKLHVEILRDRVRSFSGNTKDLFGYPTLEWFQSGSLLSAEDERRLCRSRG